MGLDRPMCKPGQHFIAKINGIPTEAKIRTVLDSTEGMKLIRNSATNKLRRFVPTK
jgi:hypothetical protein